MGTSADPDALAVYSSSATALDGEIEALATDVATAVDDFAAARPAFGAGAGSGLSERIGSVAAEQSHTDTWVGLVGFNFAMAGALGLTGDALDNYVTAMSGGSTIARSQAIADARRVAELLEDGDTSDADLVAALDRFKANTGNAEYMVAFFGTLGPQGVLDLDAQLSAAAARRGRGVDRDLVEQAGGLLGTLVVGYSLASRATGPGRDGGDPSIGVLDQAFHEELIAGAGLATLARFTGRPETGPMTEPFLIMAGERLPEVFVVGRGGESPLIETILGNIAATDASAAAHLLHDEQWSNWLLGGESDLTNHHRTSAGEGTAAIVERALFEMPEGHAWAEQDFDRLVADYWHDDIPDVLRQPLAAATGNFLPGMVDRYAGRESDITGFFAQIGEDETALGTLDVNLAGYAHQRLGAGVTEMLGADYTTLDESARMGTEMREVATLYGWLADGIQENEAAQDAHAAALSRSLRTVGGLVSTTGVAASGASGPVPAAIGYSARELVNFGSEMIESANDYDGVPPTRIVSEGLAEAVRPALVINLHATPDMQRALYPEATGPVALPPAIAHPPGPGATVDELTDYQAELDEWLRLPENADLRDQVETFESDIRGQMLDEMALDQGEAG
jgi:hypothetical protein